MAKKQTVNKTEAVKDYLKAHGKATRGEIAAALTKQGITITPGHVSNILTKLKKTRKTRKPAKKASVETAPAVVEKPKANGVITLEQIKKVAHTVKAMGGFQRMTEMLDVIKEAGGVKKFKDLAEAMRISPTDAIPF